MKPSIDPGSWVLQFAALLLEVWRDSDIRAQRRHRKAVEDLTLKAARKADAIARQSSTTGNTVAPEGVGALLLDGDGEAIKVLMRVAVDPPSMPRDRRWWPDSADARLAGLDGSTAAPALVWLDELPFLLLEELKSDLSKNPLRDLRLESRITEGIERLVATPRWPSVRERRSEVDRYLRQVLERATAAPPHGGWGVARVNQPVRVRPHDTRLRPQEELELADDRDPYHPKGAEAHADREPPRLWSDVRDEWRQVSILGEPGYGKSWLLRDAAEAIARASLRDLQTGTEPEDVTLPAPVRLDAVAEHLTGARKIDAAIVAALGETYGLTPALQTWLIDRLAGDSDSDVVLLDGLDEVDEGSRIRVVEGIRHWQSACRVLLTSRVAGYPPTRINDQRTWGEVELIPFREEQVVGFLAQWFALPGTEASDVAQELFSKPWLAGMVRVPLLLSLVCLLLSDPAGARARPSRVEPPVLKDRLAGLPRHRAGLYGQVVRRFLHAAHRDRAGLDDADVDRIIGEGAKIAWAFSNTSSGWAERLNAEQVKTAAEPLLDRDSTEEALHLLRETGLLISDGFADGLVAYRFLHRTFHEYLCAQQLANLPEQERLTEVHRHLWFDPDWEQVILLLAGILDDPTALLHELAGQDDDPFEHALALAVRAAVELPTGTGTDLRYIFDEAIRSLDAERSEIASALNATVVAGNTHATTGIAHLLAYDDPGVLVKAAGALEGTSDPDTLAALTRLLEHDHPDVLVAAARALRVTSDSHALAALTRLLEHGDPGVLAVAAWALEGTSDPDTLAALTRLLEHDHPHVLVAAAGALEGTTDPHALAALTRLLEHDHPHVLVAAAQALEGTTDPHALAALTRLLEHDGPGVRVAAAGALEGTTDPDALTALTGLLADPHSNVCETAAEAIAAVQRPRQCREIVEALTPLQGRIEPKLVLTVLRGIVPPAFRGAEDPDGLRRTVAAMIERARAAL